MKINKGHYIELMDRLHVQLCNIEDHLLNHPITGSNIDLKTKISIASGILAEAYQDVGDLEIKSKTK